MGQAKRIGDGKDGGRLRITLSAGPALAADNPLQPSPAWEDMRSSVTGSDIEPPIDPAVFDLEAPMRAENPALVPIRVTQVPGSPRITKLALVVDHNPAPVAGEFTFGPATAPLDFEVRVRVDAYSDVRAIATLEDGLYTLQATLDDPAMQDRLVRFVRASMKGWKYAEEHPEEAAQIVLDNDETGAQTEAHQVRMMQEVAKLTAGSNGALDEADYQRTVDTLLAGGSDPVISKAPEGAWSHAITDKALQ